MRMSKQERRRRIRHLKKIKQMERKREKAKNKISGRFMNRIVITMILAAFIFTIIMTIVFIRVGSEPSTLIENVFQFLSVEGGALALIKSVKTVTKSREKSEEKQCDNEPDASTEEVQG